MSQTKSAPVRSLPYGVRCSVAPTGIVGSSSRTWKTPPAISTLLAGAPSSDEDGREVVVTTEIDPPSGDGVVTPPKDWRRLRDLIPEGTTRDLLGLVGKVAYDAVKSKGKDMRGAALAGMVAMAKYRK